jgi:hypothetical protein
MEEVRKDPVARGEAGGIDALALDVETNAFIDASAFLCSFVVVFVARIYCNTC